MSREFAHLSLVFEIQRRDRDYRGDDGYRWRDRGGRGPPPRGGFYPEDGKGYRGGHGGELVMQHSM